MLAAYQILYRGAPLGPERLLAGEDLQNHAGAVGLGQIMLRRTAPPGSWRLMWLRTVFLF